MTRTRTNREWLDELQGQGPLQEAALLDLRELLLRATLFHFGRSLGDFGGLERGEIIQRAEDCAQDALMAVTAHLADFRGDSKFTTWAYKFAINMALMAARHERWKGVSLDEVDESGTEALDRLAGAQSAEAGPERSAIQDEIRLAIRDVIENDLTERQRKVLSLIVFNEVPMDEVVRHLGVDRNAVYKTLHDARRKLKSRLQDRGFGVGETLSLF